MAENGNEQVATDENTDVTLNTKVDQDTAAAFRILAIVKGKNVSGLLGGMVKDAVENANLTITVDGKEFNPVKQATKS